MTAKNTLPLKIIAKNALEYGKITSEEYKRLITLIEKDVSKNKTNIFDEKTMKRVNKFLIKN